MSCMAVLWKHTMRDNMRPDLLRCDSLRCRVSDHSVLQTGGRCRLQQTALFPTKAGKIRQITDCSGLRKHWHTSLCGGAGVCVSVCVCVCV